MDDRGITYKAHLALTWQPVTIDLSKPDSQIDEHNHVCLQQALLLDELTNTASEELKSEHSDTIRLEKKLDLVFSLLRTLITHQQQQLPHTDCQISYRHLEWKDAKAQSVNVGDGLEVSINIHPLTIQPMRLYGKVTEAGASSIMIDFGLHAYPWQDLLEKYLFLQHRRQIAAQRHR